MFGHYLRFIARHLNRNRAYWIITLLGFSVGLGAALVVALYAYDDMIYDRSIPDSENIYRLYSRIYWEGEFREYHAPTSGALAVQMLADFPEVEAMVRMQAWGPRSVQRADLPPNQSRGVSVETVYADSSFLSVFDYKLIAGTKEGSLGTPNSIILTQSTAELLYGKENPVGKPVIAAGLGEAVVGAVIADPPARSHMQFGMVLPVYLNEENAYWFNAWNNLWVLVYAKVVPGADFEAIELRLHELLTERMGWDGLYPTFMPLTDIHLHSANQNYNWINANPSDIGTLRVLGAIALGILLIAAINFINLTTARALKRAREVGMRKTLGATRSDLIRSYLGESVLMTFIAALIAMVIVEVSAPLLANSLGKDISGLLFSSPEVLGIFLGATLLTGLISGIYPAFVLTAFKPVEVLRGDFRASRAGIILRQSLTTLQFAISVILIISVLIMRDQIKYILNLDMGYDREQVMVFEISNLGTDDQKDEFLRRLNADPTILAAGTSNNTPGPDLPWVNIRIPDLPEDQDNSGGAIIFEVRGDWLDAVKIPLIEGRALYMDNDVDVDRSIVVNEEAVKSLELENPIGVTVMVNGDPRTIVGVVADFNFRSAREGLQPVVITNKSLYSTRTYVRLPAGRIPEAVAQTRKIFSEVYGQQLFGYNFLDDMFTKQYNSDERFAANAGAFSILAILIAALGIFGMTTYTTEQRRREISVRKVLGASESGILWLLSQNLLKWVLVANVIAWPVAWYVMKKWLEQFDQHILLLAIPFIVAGLASLIIAFVTVSIKTAQVVRLNPANELRAE